MALKGTSLMAPPSHAAVCHYYHGTFVQQVNQFYFTSMLPLFGSDNYDSNNYTSLSF